MPSLTDLYIGAGISPRTSKSVGSTASVTTSGLYLQQKRRKAERDLATGRATKSSLGTSQLAALGLNNYTPSKSTRRHSLGGGIFKDLTGFFGNLGKDVGDFATGLPGGLVALAKATAHDVNPFKMKDSRALYTDIIKPFAKHEEEMYFHGNPLHNIYQHPLGPILDAAMLVSGGAAAAGKVGKVAARDGSTTGLARLANVKSREGRPDISLPGGPAIKREYTPRPLARGGQIGLDALGRSKVGDITGLGEFQAKRAMQRDARLAHQENTGAIAATIADTARPLIETGKDLSPDESLAYSLAVQGVNTPERIAAYQDSVRAALADPEKAAKAEALGIPKAIIERRGTVPEHVQRLVLDPAYEPLSQAKIRRFHRAWEADVQRGLDQLPIEPAVHQARVGMVQRLLDRTDEVRPPDFAPGQIEPTYMPHVQASNFEVHVPREKLSRVIPFVKPGEEVIRPRKRSERTVETGAVTAQNIFVPRSQRYLADTSGDTFLEGLFRTDPKVFVEHAIRRERDLHERAFKKELVNAQAARGADGEILKFKNNTEFAESGLRDTHVLVNPEFPIAWFRAETNFIKQAGQIIDRLMEHGDEANAAVLQKMIADLSDADARAFLTAHWGAMKRPGVAVPKEFFEYQKDFARVSDPFNNAGGRVWARFMHHWRNTVLAYMPRWGLNTAIGSFVTNVVKGVVNPMDYVRGQQMGRQFRDEAGNLVSQPGRVARARGAQPLDFGSQRYEKVEPAGVSLQGEAIQEHLEGSMAGYQNALGISFPTRRLVAGVQHIEDFFRRASFQQSLRKMGHEKPLSPVATEEMGDVLSDHFNQVAAHNGDVQAMLKDPVLVQRALRDVNKFGYNYGALGPFERRYVRQFMPFYGWYKFISTLAAKLPVEYPGRTTAMNAFAQLGTDMQNDLGPVPDWVKGSIILGLGNDGVLKYLPTRGMNPFATFFNPLSPSDTVQQMSGMMNPAIQAGLQGLGYDTLTGDAVRVSPESGVGRDFSGVLRNESGDVVAPRDVQPLTRALMGLLRSVPGYRLGEKYNLEGGASVYPEHVPFGIQTRLMSPESSAVQTHGATAFGLSLLGANPRGYDLANYQRLRKKGGKYVEKKNRNSMRRTQAKFRQAAP